MSIVRPEVYGLEQEFCLFDPHQTRKFAIGNNKNSLVYERVISLESGRIPQFPIDIIAYESGGEFKYRNITPFNPEAGYQIDDNDYIWQYRLTKHRLLRPFSKGPSIPRPPEVDSEKAPLRLGVGSGPDGQRIYKEISRYYSEFDFTDPDVLNFFARLRLELAFPLGRYVSKPGGFFDLGLMFDDFYPVDRGPLALPSSTELARHYMVYEGFGIMLPEDPNKLAQVFGRLFLGKPITILTYPSQESSSRIIEFPYKSV